MPKHLPHISIEKYAAYLDGNLPDEEMQQMDAFIQNDPEMQAFVEAGNYIDAISETALLEDEPVPFEIELPTIELPSIDTELPFEPNSYIDDFFPIDSGRFEEEMGSIMDDDVSHHEFLDETSHMNGNFGIEDNPIGLAASEDEGEVMPDATYDWGIHDGDYGYLELGLPPIITQDDINNDIPTPFTEDL